MELRNLPDKYTESLRAMQDVLLRLYCVYRQQIGISCIMWFNSICVDFSVNVYFKVDLSFLLTFVKLSIYNLVQKYCFYLCYYACEYTNKNYTSIDTAS